MTTTLTIVKPVTVTPAMLVDTDVPETDHAAWSAATTYARGDRVIVLSTHKVYESLQAGNLNKDPLTQTGWWLEVSPTNRWKAFDLSNDTQTAQAGSMFFEIKPGSAVNAVSLQNVTGVREVRYRLTDPSFGLVYDKTWKLTTSPGVSSWYSWFFGQRVEQVQNVDLGLPSYPNATLRIDLVGASNMAVGVILMGQQKSIGVGVLQGVGLGIQDYSRKEPNEFGDVTLVERAYSKRASFPLLLDNRELDNTYALLASIRATPCLFIGGRFAATTIFGFYKDFEILVSYANHSDCSIDIEGLT